MNHHIMLLSDTYRVDLQENRGVALLQQPQPPLAISILQKVAYVFDSNNFFISCKQQNLYNQNVVCTQKVEPVNN